MRGVPFVEAFDPLLSHRVVLFGGKGGVGKTTVALAAALHVSSSRPTVLFTSDPSSSLADFTGERPLPAALTVEALDADALYGRFLSANLESFLEIGDRGTYLDREELRRLLELSLPGIDELMAWMRIGELAEQRPDALVVVDTAPTGHTVRMLASSAHFRQLAHALDTMQEKHRAMVRQFTRRRVRDAYDAFIEELDAAARRRSELLADPGRAAFVPVALSEPLVVEQTLRLVADVSMDVPFVVLNRTVSDPDCSRDEEVRRRDTAARAALAPHRVIDAPRSCVPLDSVERIAAWSRGAGIEAPPDGVAAGIHEVGFPPVGDRRFVFLAGKGGVGKTTCATALALHLAHARPEARIVAISVDPAHSLRDVFSSEAPPANLSVEAIDTKEKWRRFRGSIGEEIESALDSLTPRGMSVEYEQEAMQQLLELAPPGADELFAVTRLADLASDESVGAVVVDTAPTGHFLRLLDLPLLAGEWVREFMRLLLRYREIVPAGTLGQELVRASKALKDLDRILRSGDTGVIVVTRPERVVAAETRRLTADLARRRIPVMGIVANYVTPRGHCACDASMRRSEEQVLAALQGGEAGAPPLPLLRVERRDDPPSSLPEIEALLPAGLKMQP